MIKRMFLIECEICGFVFFLPFMSLHMCHASVWVRIWVRVFECSCVCVC